MPDYRRYFDKDFIAAFDLATDDGKPVNAVVTIEAVDQGELQSPGKSAKRRAPVVTFKGRRKKLVLNATNGRLIADMYGNDTRKWIGQRITLYPTTTRFGPKTVDCVRVKPAPKNAADTVEKAEAVPAIVAELTREPVAALDPSDPRFTEIPQGE